MCCSVPQDRSCSVLNCSVQTSQVEWSIAGSVRISIAVSSRVKSSNAVQVLLGSEMFSKVDYSQVLYSRSGCARSD